MHIYNIIIIIIFMQGICTQAYTRLPSAPTYGTEAVDVKGAESGRSSLRVTCSGSSPTRGLTGMKYHTRNKTGRRQTCSSVLYMHIMCNSSVYYIHVHLQYTVNPEKLASIMLENFVTAALLPCSEAHLAILARTSAV